MSKDARSAIKNSVASITGQMANLLVGLISSIYVARVLGREQFGMLSWALGLVGIVRAVANLGVDNVITRDIAGNKDKAPEYLLSSFVMKLLSTSLCYLGISVYLQMRGYTGLQLAVGYVLCTMVIFESLDCSCRAVLVGVERQDLSVVVSVTTNVLRVAAVVTLVYLGYNVVAVAWVTVCVMLLTLVLHLVVIHRLVRGAWRPTMSAMKHLLVIGSTFFASQFFAGVFDRADYIMLDWYKDVGQVGIYSAAYRIMEIVTMIAYSSSLALFPIMSRRVHGSKEAYARAIERSTKYLAIVGIPLCGCVFLLSHQIMVGLYSNKFAGAGTCLAILIWSRLITFAILPGQQAVQARNAQLWLVPPVIVRVLVNIPLNVYLIPRSGYIGASVSMVIADNIYYALMYVFAFRGPERFNPITLLSRPVLAGLAMAAVVLLMRPLGMIAATTGGVIAYGLALPAFGAIDSDDRRILGGLVRDFRNRRRKSTEEQARE